MVFSQSSVADEFAIRNFIASGEGEWLYGPDGAEITVNSTYARSQAHSDVTRLANGNFIVTWVDADFNTTAGRFIRAQVFAPDGTALGAELTLVSANVGTEPTIAALANGGFVVAWRPLGSVVAQMFDANGVATSPVINVSPTGAFGIGRPDIAVLANGGFAVVWDDERTTGADISRQGVHLRAYDQNGASVGGDVLVNTATSRSQFDASITALAEGGYVVAWTDTGAGSVIKAQIYSAAGTRVGTEFKVNSSATVYGSVAASVTLLANGNFAVAWYESGPVDSAHHVQVFTPAGARVGAESSVLSGLSGTQTGPVIAALSDGGYAIAWTTDGASTADGSGKAVLVQVYGADGQPNGAPMLVNSQTGGDQLDPSIVALADGAFVVTWTDLNGVGADDDQVKAQIFAPQTNEPNERPVIVSDGGGTSASIDVDEGQTFVTTVVATDADGPNPVTYSITGGWAAHLFTIDAATGVLSFAAAPDYENPLEDSGNFYSVQVTASDGDLSTFQSVQVMVRNVNEGVTVTSSAAVTAEENHPYVTQVTASDLDGDLPGFSIAGGADSALFEIDAVTGHLFFLGAPDFETPLDADGDGVYEVTVRASDGALHDDLAMSVTVGDVEDGFAISSYGGADSVSLTMVENAYRVGQVEAWDGASGWGTYAIAGGADAALFEIDSVTGELQFIYADRPDFEAPGDSDGDNVYEVAVIASLGAASDTQAFALTIVNDNEGVSISSNGGGWNAAISTAENESYVTTVVGYDPDGTVPTYAIMGGADASLFTIDAATGVLRFVAAPDRENPADAGGDNVYVVEVGASDGYYTTWQTLQVAVGNVNEGIAFVSGGGGDEAEVAIGENQGNVAVLLAADPDGTAPHYGIAGGADAALFVLDGVTRTLRFAALPDFEAPGDSGGDNVYEVIVGASDGELFDYQTIRVTVGNVYEGLSFAAPSIGFAAGENGVTVGTVAASGEPGLTIAYGIAGGADAHLFAIDAATGALAFVAAPDFELPADWDGDNVYEVIVSASDGVGPGGAYQSVSVAVGNVDEGVEISSFGGEDTVWLDLAENEDAVGQVAALDEDGDAVTYAIAGGADASLFTIDAETGALSYVAAPNFETPADADGDNVYKVEVAAISGAFVDTQAFVVTVANVNEGLAITSNGGGNSASLSIGENGRDVTTVTAADLDGTSATYSIVGGADAARFTIDAQTGALQFIAAPDYEAPTDLNGDNVYSLVVQAADGQYSDNQALSVTVLNLRDGNNVTGTNGGDSISGTSTNPALRTSNEEDTVFGRDGHDTILGLAGDDHLYGDAGNDTLTGGAGADRLTGGLGKDQFVYTSLGDSAPGAHDLIADFSRSQNDKISLSAIDANSAVGGNQAFAFIGTSAFTNVAGQLRYENSGGTTMIFADVNGDGVADLQIQVAPPLILVASDFIL
jgi:Ca2+-binding RTX toxin-like protein